MSQVPSSESLLIHAGTARELGRAGTPPSLPASCCVSWCEPPAAGLIADIGHAREVL